MYGRRRAGLGLFLLAAQLFQVGIDRIPPVTLSVIGLNTALFLNILSGIPRLGQACVSVNTVWYNNEWQRLFLAPFFHLNDWHLYFNMASFLWKGMSLERSLGSRRFLYILSVFSVLTSGLLLGIDMVFARFFNDPSYMYTCAAGFSGVIFALKVLTTYNLPRGMSHVMGIPVPVRYACWAELFVIQLLIPNASFSGHLAGIIVGMLYTKGPLKHIMDGVASTTSLGGRTRGFASGPSYNYQSGTAGTRSQQTTRRDSENEQLQDAIRRSLQETHFTPAPSNHDGAPDDDYTDPELQQAISDSLSQSHGQQPSNVQDPTTDGMRRRNIYPNISNEHIQNSVTPSAPPLLDFDDESTQRPQNLRRNGKLTEQELREQRLKRFQK